MFWKKSKKDESQKKEELSARLTVIPDIFYGGADPLIYHEQEPIKMEQKKKDEIKRPSISRGSNFSKKNLIIISSIVFLLAASGFSWYYIKQSSPAGKISQKDNLQIEEQRAPAPEVPVVTPPVESTTTPEMIPLEETAPIATSTLEAPLVFPRILLRDSSDIDVDALTDLEEELFNTDSGIWDTDKDGYYDGQEVFNLYNPTGFAPVRLVDSGLVREYVNPVWQYRDYYPISWVEGEVDSNSEHVLFSSITGDFIEIRAIRKETGDTFEAWFAKKISGQRFADLLKFKNRFGMEGMKRKDDLAAYFATDAMVYVMIYQPANDAQDIPFRHVMQVMYQSFRSSGLSAIIPEQTILPQ